jgi:methylmalonyl-CoA mutase
VKIEGMGGIIKAFESGYILQEVEKTCQKRDMDIATRKTSILGTNIFPNIQEEMLDDIKKDIHGKKTEGLKLYRGAEAFEELRLETERFKKAGNKRPSVLLIGYGNLAMRKARANFASNFFGVAGYEILDEFEAIKVKDVIYHLMEKDPCIIVYCSSDEEYSGMATEIMKAAAKEKSITGIHVIAGYPKEQLEALKSAGASDFIHVRSNLLDVLKGYNVKLMTKDE